MPTAPIAGRYRLEELLGTGGMSEVWRATDLELERAVAVKLLAADADRTRFGREARAVAALAHPNITQLFDYGESEGRPYMVLEYLPGGTLEQRLTPGQPLDDTDTRRIANELAAGLAHAHSRGLVHRDLKPANVLFDGEGRAKIADFGIARLAESGTLTATGTVLGTAAYISPEQASGEPATTASDVYSFGVILFRLLAGELPFIAENAVALAMLHRDAPAPAVTELRPDAPRDLVEIASATLAKDPRDRPADGAALTAALAGAAPATAAPTALLTAAPTDRHPRRRRWALLLAALLALLAIGGVAIAFSISHSDGGEAGTTPPTATTAPTTAQRTTALTTASTTTAPESTAPTATEPTTATSSATTTSRTTTRPSTRTTTPATTAAPEPVPTDTSPPTDTTPTGTTTGTGP